MTSACVQVVGQGADLMDLQRILRCGKERLSDRDEQNMTARPWQHRFDPAAAYPARCLTVVWSQRWAVYQAANLLRKYSKEYEALQVSLQAAKACWSCVVSAQLLHASLSPAEQPNLQEAMSRGAAIPECIAAIEGC